MPGVLTALRKEQEIASVVAKVARKLAPDVVRIRHNIGEDWSGDPAIFFRVLLSDSASEEDRLYKVAKHVKAVLSEAMQPYEALDLFEYFNFRSESEQAEIQEKSWA